MTDDRPGMKYEARQLDPERPWVYTLFYKGTDKKFHIGEELVRQFEAGEVKK